MSITTTLATLQAKNLAINGITTAPTNYPSTINTADLPMAITLPSSGEWSTQAVGLNRQDRTYRIIVYVEPVGQGTIDQRMDVAIPIITKLGAAYLNDLSIATDANIDHILQPITDTGPIELFYGGNAYVGFEMQLTVVEKS